MENKANKAHFICDQNYNLRARPGRGWIKIEDLGCCHYIAVHVPNPWLPCVRVCGRLQSPELVQQESPQIPPADDVCILAVRHCACCSCKQDIESAGTFGCKLPSACAGPSREGGITHSTLSEIIY